MTVYRSQQALAQRQIAAKGAAATFTRTVAAGTYDPITDTTSQIKTLRGTAPAVVLPMGRGDLEKMAGHSNLRRMRKALVAGQAITFVPRPGDTMKWNGTTYAVDAAEVLEPDGDPILITLYVSA